MKATTKTTTTQTTRALVAAVFALLAALFACALGATAAPAAFAAQDAYTASTLATQDDGDEAASGAGESDQSGEGSEAQDQQQGEGTESGTDQGEGGSQASDATADDPTVDYDAEIVLTAASDKKTYDGQPLVNSEVKATGLPEGYTVATIVDGSQTRANANADGSQVFYTSTNHISSYTILRNGQDVTNKFTNVRTEDGTLVVMQREVHITTGSAQKPYDGTPLEGATAHVPGTDQSVVIDGLVEGEEIYLEATGSRTEVGSSPNYYSMNWHNLADSAVSRAYFEINYSTTVEYGTLTIVQGDVMLMAPSATKMYDGTPLTADGTDKDNPIETFGSLSADSTVKATVEGSQTDAGSSENVIKAFEIYDENGDLQGSMSEDGKRMGTLGNATLAPGTLTVEKRSVILASNSATKIYDGKPLTADQDSDVTVAGDGFVGDQGATYAFTGSQTLIGSSDNAFTYQLKSNTDAKNYDIATTQGKLTVIAPEAADLANYIIEMTDDGIAHNLGENATWTIKITNPYDYDRTITVSAPLGEGFEVDNPVFRNVEPGQTVTATLTRPVTEADLLAGKAVGSVEVGISPVRMSVSDEAPVAAQAPAISVKRTYDFDEGQAVAAGQTVTGEFVIKNTGNVTVSDLSLVTQLLSGSDGQKGQQIGSLAPGESATIKLTYLVTEDDVLNGGGQLQDGYQVSGTAPAGTPVSAGDAAAMLPVQTASRDLGVTVTVNNPQELYRVGSSIGFTIEVTNKGNVTLSDVAVVDQVGDQSQGALSLGSADGVTVERTTAKIDTLAPGQSKQIPATYQIARVDAGTSITNTATATATAIDASTSGAATAGPVEPLYTLRINYAYEDGSEASASYVDSLLQGEPYSILFPAIDGFVVMMPDSNGNLLPCTGVSGNMSAQDITLPVLYQQSVTEPENGGNGNNDNGNGGSTDSGNSGNAGNADNANSGSSANAGNNNGSSSGTADSNATNANAGTGTNGSANGGTTTNEGNDANGGATDNSGTNNNGGSTSGSTNGGFNAGGSSATTNDSPADTTNGATREATVQTTGASGGNAGTGTTGTTAGAGTGTGAAAADDDDADDSGDEADEGDDSDAASNSAASANPNNDNDDSDAGTVPAVPPANSDDDTPTPNGTITIGDDGVATIQSIDDDANALSSGVGSSVGSWSLVDALATVAAVVLVGSFGRKREDVQGTFDSEADRFRAQTASQKRHTLRRVAAVVSALLAIVAVGGLLVTQDFAQPMVLLDTYTPLFVSVALLNVILAIICLAGRRTNDPEDTTPAYVLA